MPISTRSQGSRETRRRAQSPGGREPSRSPSPAPVRVRKRLTKTPSKKELPADGMRYSYFEPETLEHSEFYGFVNLLILSTLVTVGTVALNAFLERGYVVDLKIVFATFKDLQHTFLVFVLMNLLSFVVVLVEKMANSVPTFALYLTHHTVLGVLFSGVTAQLLSRDTPWLAAASLCSNMIVLAMKMHSYFMVNRQYQVQGSPRNTTFSHFLLFLCSPFLVYQLTWPRTERIRVWYVVEKLVSVVGIILMMMMVIQEFVNPVYYQLHTMNPLIAYSRLMVPMMVLYMCIFFVIFEVILNGMAELTRYGDRYFYSDWWNSTSFDDFSRKWNKPVHNWLLRHIYLESIDRAGMSKANATWMTFLFSGLLHEFIMAVSFRIVRFYLLGLMMFQLVLIWIGRMPIFKGTRLGNFGFWAGFFTGLPLLYFAYAREYQLQIHAGVNI